MKFRIRFAEQIVGVFIIIALASLAFVIVMLGRSQRWFAKDHPFTTSFASATGLSKNQAVLYKGFTIGNVKSFRLSDNDQVEVSFFIYDQYRDRVTEGSLVEIMVSPIGLGNQFLFHAGLGKSLVEDGGFIPPVNSPQAQNFIAQGLAADPRHDDSISLILNRASTLLDTINRTVADIDNLVKGSGPETPLSRTLGHIETITKNLEPVPAAAIRAVDGIKTDVDAVAADIGAVLDGVKPVLANVETLTEKLNDPDGLLYTVLDTNEPVYQNLVASLKSLTAMMQNLERTTSFIAGQSPQLASLLSELRMALKTAGDVLTALTNNPLLRKGIPEKADTRSNGTSPRDVRF